MGYLLFDKRTKFKCPCGCNYEMELQIQCSDVYGWSSYIYDWKTHKFITNSGESSSENEV